ncbi:phosphoglycerol transferase MdoB-like AlkP superfamily enzyme [Mucilaginibacter gracilis]|uniref:Phosphoglycerol transferase MdoB-like AlkP superfamily enzyme n=1 Tax=Mucilaginibacter gracilis TaxID=423350 RepID=A0A495J8A2_9SPHI|nr:alkaline phosphatase family protein [Mucilaginibacter gracilis]RKR84981.1 phosphoglycerol transferase MdoB-like AlkP superfamily enzyme [Mucilaginibacter gracilis]
MLKNLFCLVRFYLFWLIFFFITRVTFEIYFRHKLKIASVKEIIESFLYAVRLDLSTAAYIAIIPLLVSIIIWLVPGAKIKAIWLRIYIWICLVLVCFLTILDLNIFTEWGTKVNYRVFDSIIHQFSESLASSGSSPIALCITIGVVMLCLGIFIAEKLILYRYRPTKASVSFKLASSAFLILLNLFFIRGGLQPSPINQSMAYFSSKQILNQSALNTEWNLFDNIFENLKAIHNPYLYFDPKFADSLSRTLYAGKADTTLHVLTTTRPNIVIFQLESFTADVIQSLGGDKGVCPNFENFIKSGILCDSIYSAGDRTDKGIVAILSAFPSQAVRTIVTDNTKQEKLPSISSALKDVGYHTSFYYGGEVEYMNFKSYLLSHNIDHITSEDSFEHRQIDTKWGVDDGAMLNAHIQYLNKETKPFFSLVETLTNHEPFDMPAKPHFPGDSVSNQFRSTAYYTDSVLNSYFEQAKKQAWYKNTLFILVADHGHRLPRNTNESYMPAKYHIPLLLMGGAIKDQYRGMKIHKLGGQTDIAATILAQLNLPYAQFKWSKDLLNPGSKSFTFFDWDNGFGFITPEQGVSFDNIGKETIFIKNPKVSKAVNEKHLQYGKAYLQQVFAEYVGGH